MKISHFIEKTNHGYIINDGHFENFAMITNVVYPHSIIYISDSKFIDYLNNDYISCIITTEKIFNSHVLPQNIGVLIVSISPRDYFYEIFSMIEHSKSKKNQTTIIGKYSKISENAFISKNNVIIGEGTVIEDGAIIKPDTVIGDNCVIRSGTIISTEGFESYTGIDGYQKIVPHSGKTIIGDNVELQALNAVSKGLFVHKNTIIGNEVLTDNMVHIAHGVTIGKKTKIAASAMIAGSAEVGENVWIGPSASISSGVKIGDYASITIGSVVTRDVAAGERVSGNFAIDHEKYIKFIRSIR